jgi:hypothetical protein
MSEPIAERLSRFTPDAGALDRDALLFAAGRASARPNRRWVVLAGMLAACQLLTFLLLWPRATPGVAPVVRSDPPSAVPDPPRALGPPQDSDPAELWVLRQRLLGPEGDLPPPRPVHDLRLDGPPLRAFGVSADVWPQ